MQFKTILSLIALASAAPLLQVREEGIVTITSWEIATVTQYTTVWVDSLPTTTSPAEVPSSTPSAPSSSQAPPTTSVQPSPVTAIQQAPVLSTPVVHSSPPPETTTSTPASDPVPTPITPVIGNNFRVNTLLGASAPNGPCTPNSPCSGDITHYNPSQGVGSCGPKDWASGAIYTDADMVVAVSHTIMGSISNGGTADSVNDLCKRSVYIKGQSGGQDVVAKVVDKCAGCSQNFALDLSPAVWAKVAPSGDGRVHDVEWYWV